ncbi:Tm-1-like ATP-binding domain-containing protein [Parapedobacter pyrenivorans]|uniref:Tm-1-like ATP-binding domain-containing protein n=1 Tax=Parapedobacter pyrenivorans TaxID=1305674 RepID=UPI003341BCDB
MAKEEVTIAMLGCFDTKGEDFAFLRGRILAQGYHVFSINLGVKGTTDLFPVDIEAEEVAAAGGSALVELRSQGDRGIAVECMGRGAAVLLGEVFSAGMVAGVVGMGGGGGTYMVLAAMQSLPFGMPKVCLSTVAAKDLSQQMGSADIVLVPSVVDLAGVNSISRVTIGHAASAIVGMVHGRAATAPDEDVKVRGRVAISMFGNTTACVNACTALLRSKGYEVFSFHANGAGGRTMESLIAGGYFDGVLDITTTELADELCGGICSAGPDRLEAAARRGVPQVVVPGCVDMVNFGTVASVPVHYKERCLYSWAPDVTLMRTDVAENRILGEQLVRKVAAAPEGTVVIMLPGEGLSQLDAEGGLFYRPLINRVLFDTIKGHSEGKVRVNEVPLHINDRGFAALAVESLINLMGNQNSASIKNEKDRH